MYISASTLVSALLLAASNVAAQQFTTTYPWANGDTVVLSTGTNALGVATTRTIQTLTGTATTTARTTATTTTAADDDDDDDATTTTTGKTTTTQQRVVGNTPTTTAAPMRTTTYWLDPGDGVYTAFTWTAPTTALPTVATANVPAGTIQEYNEYQSAVNSVVLQSAEAAVANGSSSGGLPRRQIVGMDALTGAWTTLVLGAVGAGIGVFML
ncbi:hypothetical protein L486_05477 [Kwoniella mangroviensis CBS 10435]|uniref:Uncharacterized protein n=1 Tax=Kwoniella mangroviensis CBS 10435 TaxID=1331196 RepID=A0A1B9IMN2_9TREE|nr:uncharacterized protein I203_05608 [Kwoniella mangroviensis CBS 8507]OCF56624.1 hypothetical protein L486_05477 [Kwoniella mangroviensis CBS 10435]OCF65359.1 hypothetical protein I203_05608 [Kwoniella mangroviensis CBS 8507]